ncbi:response regulator transcription factor [Tenacibaculum sp. M341]|uniref:response regulator transcription factor n=1 Tax=Tenacibaculum sp. M341 TaxID=2530339 RepID=UPI001050D3AF|nr:helix-turn-helix transcriptional regulator [Tenacibaculum sp. M341]TCI89978.1 LuxR family transcriptional regulator [Tenacibaculum sp. M341]
MANINDFFHSKNNVDEISEDDRKKAFGYLDSVKAFAKTTYKSIYIIDYEKKGFEYVSDNPLFLCGHTAEEVKEMGYSFYFNHVSESDLALLLKINTIGFDFYEEIPVENRKNYTISYDFHLKNNEGKEILINQKLTPLFLTKEGKIWKALCIISLSSEQTSGNIKIFNTGDDKVYKYNLEKSFWETTEKIKLTSREKEILRFSIRGFAINEIAKVLFVSPDTIKFHRRKLFEKLGVVNISEAISYATNNQLI